MKKVFLFFFLLLMAFSQLSCSNQDNGLDKDNSNEESNTLDLTGVDYLIATGWKNQFYPSPEEATEWGDRVLKRYRDIEEKYGCTISCLDLGVLDQGTFLTTIIASDQQVPEIFDVHAYDAYKFYKAEMLMPYEELNIDLSDTKWGPSAFLQYGFFGGQTYGVFTYDWETMPEVAGIILFNLELMKTNGINASPHEMEEKGEWVWDGFTQLLKDCVTPNPDITPLGFGGDSEFLMKAAIFSNNGEIVKKTDTGYQFSLDSPEAMQAMEWVSSLNKDNLIKTVTPENFALGKSYFLSAESWVGTHTDTWMNGKYPAANLKDYSLINMPIGPNGTQGSASSFVHTARRLWWIPEYTGNDKDEWAVVMNEMFNPLDNSDKEAWKEMCKRNIFFYTEGYDSYVNSVDNTNYDYSVQINDTKVKNSITSAFRSIFTGSKTPVSAFDGIKESVQDLINIELNG